MCVGYLFHDLRARQVKELECGQISTQQHLRLHGVAVHTAPHAAQLLPTAVAATATTNTPLAHAHGNRRQHGLLRRSSPNKRGVSLPQEELRGVPVGEVEQATARVVPNGVGRDGEDARLVGVQLPNRRLVGLERGVVVHARAHV